MYIDDYIIYFSRNGEYVSEFLDGFETSEFPSDYCIFGSVDDAMSAIDEIVEKYGCIRSEFEVEKF